MVLGGEVFRNVESDAVVDGCGGVGEMMGDDGVCAEKVSNK